jgi:hypothetical protein
LQDNALNGAVPLELYNDHIQTLRLGGNDLEGSIPTEISQMTALRNIYLGNSRMGGELPHELFGLPLRELHLQNAHFDGPLSEDLSDLRGTIREIVLNCNNFSGSIPQGLDECILVEKLDVTGNPLVYGAISEAICKRRRRFGRNKGVASLSVLGVDCAVECRCCGFRGDSLDDPDNPYPCDDKKFGDQCPSRRI